MKRIFTCCLGFINICCLPSPHQPLQTISPLFLPCNIPCAASQGNDCNRFPCNQYSTYEGLLYRQNTSPTLSATVRQRHNQQQKINNPPTPPLTHQTPPTSPHSRPPHHSEPARAHHPQQPSHARSASPQPTSPAPRAPTPHARPYSPRNRQNQEPRSGAISPQTASRTPLPHVRRTASAPAPASQRSRRTVAAQPGSAPSAPSAVFRARHSCARTA